MTERQAPQYSGLDAGPSDDVWFGPGPDIQPSTTWTVNGHLPAPSEAALTFQPPPWYRTKPAAVALLAAASAVVAVPIVLVASPTGTPPDPAQPTSVLPQAATSTEPTLSVGEPILAPPPPAPPSPSPTEDTTTAQAPQWSPAKRKPTQKPTTGAPTPITRAPISVSPAPRQPPTTATPGTGHKAFGGW